MLPASVCPVSSTIEPRVPYSGRDPPRAIDIESEMCSRALTTWMSTRRTMNPARTARTTARATTVRRRGLRVLLVVMFSVCARGRKSVGQGWRSVGYRRRAAGIRSVGEGERGGVGQRRALDGRVGSRHERGVGDEGVAHGRAIERVDGRRAERRLAGPED